MIRRARQADMDTVLAIRARVFIEEQGVSKADERDGRDDEAIHLIAFAADQPVGTARLILDGETGKIGRVAVLSEHRGAGLGKALVEKAVEVLASEAMTRAKLGAQTHAIGFYEALGFKVTGPEYMDAGIPHRDMVRAL